MTLPEELIPVNRNDSNLQMVCPYLGTMPDPHTSVAYPSGANFCHRADNPQLVSLAHQGQYCLLEAYDTCATFRDDLISVATIDVAGPVKKSGNWKRPLAFIAVILLFGVVAFGAYALYSPFGAQSVDASTPPIQELEETTIASSEMPTPTLVVESEEAAVEKDQTEALAAASGSVVATPVVATPVVATPVVATPVVATDAVAVATADGVTEDAKMAPMIEMPTPTALPDADQEISEADVDADVSDTNTAFESLPETKPLPTVEAATEKSDETTTIATAVPFPTSEGDIADGTAVIRTGALNVRTGPGPQFPSTALAYNGQHVILLGRNGDNSWVKVRLLSGPVGWVYAAHIEPGQPLDEIPFIPRAQR